MKSIDRRLNEIEFELRELEVERSMLTKIQFSFRDWPQLIKPGDRFSQHTAVKFELLALVAEYLARPDPLLFGGASTREIYDAVVQKCKDEATQRRWRNSDPDRLADGIGRDAGTPLSNREGRINYNTFRSYLARFKAEGRLFYDDDSRRWRVSEKDLSISK
ncbi:hypothetical protein [uncultured Roseobacter sp.]|uniref:hypothetical protein n=1 Tax=uncultured Roseobacter sp. TaxID=114847 RepID=UPI002629A7F7|nr:hypothetical protein [uncultured Roseobacter sp.]